ncbi:MAG: creatinine amidohydrolase [Candidatus Tokpelaia sp. JSC188]|nr:MAG: creatinine amidohydrolase [Candidatus Tokpelaia sp. JSC188]
MIVELENQISILPIGAYEYHGPHLPFETDTLIAAEISDRVAEKWKRSDIYFIEVEPISYSIEHMRMKETKTLSYQEAIERWITIAAQQYEKGIRKFVMLNAHGGNSPLMAIVISELRARFNMLAVATSWLRFGLPKGLLTPEEQTFDIHGGFIETSVILAINPNKVDMRKAKNFRNWQLVLEHEFSYLRAYGKHTFGWLMQDLNPQGAAGNALRANAVDGRKILDHATKEFIRLLEDIQHFNIDFLA